MTDPSSVNLKNLPAGRQVLIIAGPTATGKTQLARTLFDGVIISADSRQVYRGLDIITGKDKPKDTDIYGYDLVSPGEPWNVSFFQRFATRLIPQLWRQNKLPIVVGGTGLYLKSLYSPLPQIHFPPDPLLRQKLEKLDISQLQNRLKKLDPQKLASMNDSDIRNPRRLIRAIELTSRGPTSRGRTSLKANFLKLCLTAPLPVLDRRIQERVQNRFHQNYLPELDRLDPITATATGYRELLALRQAQLSPEAALSRWAKREQQYARRQLTWFKKELGFHWFDITAPDYPKRIVDLVLSWYSGNSHASR